MDKHYIEAFRDGRQILGSGSGLNVLRNMVRPERSAAWRRIVARTEPETWKGASHWRLVTEAGRIVATHTVAS